MAISSQQKFFRRALGMLIAILALTIVASAQEAAKQKLSANLQIIKIKNFGQMDERFYRGAQPKGRDYKDLSTLGIKTVIDLRDDPELDERPMVESVGMRYVSIPMSDKKYPKPQVVELFLKTVNDPATGKFFVHCAGGRHRTGAMGAVYRFQFYHWTFDQAYKEMKQYDFYTTWGHQAFKDFVMDYYAQTPAGNSGSAQDPNAVKIQNRH
jgi:protein tyrosine/serine phosphatase